MTATLALVLAMGGTSLAASHYLITSGQQIKPRVIGEDALSHRAIASLHGSRGERGPRGEAGPTEGVSVVNFDGGPGFPSDPVDRWRRGQAVSVTTHIAGKLWMTVSQGAFLVCSNQITDWYLTLDGHVERHTVQPTYTTAQPSGGFPTVTASGVSDAVIPPGKHTIRLAGTCAGSGTDTGSGASLQSRGGVIVLGS